MTVGSLGAPEGHQQEGAGGRHAAVMSPIVERDPAPTADAVDVGRRPHSPSMLTAYRRILSVPGALLFSATGLVGPPAVVHGSSGIVLLVAAETGSYGLAGLLAAATTIANAVASIVEGRCLDRLGQPRVLPPLIVVWGLAVVGLVLSVHGDWQRWTAFVCAVVMGLTLPPIGTCVRARWAHVVSEPRALQTAYALESAVDEAVFIARADPGGRAERTAWDPAAGLGAMAVAGVGGTLFLATQRAASPPAHPPAAAPSRTGRGCRGER